TVDDGALSIAPAERAEWTGPTNCMAVVERILSAAPGVEFSANQLVKVVADSGEHFRKQTVLDAAKALADQGVLSRRLGARNATIYTWRDGSNYDETTLTDEGDDDDRDDMSDHF